jgi:cation:H+ antiporter
MEEALAELLAKAPWIILAGVIVVCLFLLAEGAEWLVREAVTLSSRSGIPKVVVGATIISIGTTTPEAVVSVLAAITSRPGLALGNAVGSIIADTGLILGLACLIAPLPLQRRIVNRQGWLQFACGVALVLSCLPFGNLGQVFTEGGRLPRVMGLVFLLGLAAYLVVSVRWARQGNLASDDVVEEASHKEERSSITAVALKLIAAIVVVVASSWVLIPAVSEAAMRLQVPESIIAATMVAFGTSLPELVTAVTAARHGHGELAVGNIVGADILNVLFVAGASAAVTRGGLQCPAHFFTLYFPSMLLVLIVFRVGIFTSGSHLRRPFGFALLGTYIAVTILSYVVT